MHRRSCRISFIKSTLYCDGRGDLVSRLLRITVGYKIQLMRLRVYYTYYLGPADTTRTLEQRSLGFRFSEAGSAKRC